jgi:hypothetical protein
VHSYADGRVVIEGQDLRGEDELEYFFTIAPVTVPRLVGALGGAAGDDPLALLLERGESIVLEGEMHWLQAHDIAFELHTW